MTATWTSPTLPRDWFQYLLLRAGLAFVFSYAAVSSLIDPSRLSSYMPEFLPAAWVSNVLMPAFTAYEVVLVGCLVAGRRIFEVSLLSALTLAGIVVVNPDAFEQLFRNVAIALAALALAVQARRREPMWSPAPLPPMAAAVDT